MRPKYSTPSIVLSRTPHGEASATIALLTYDFGLVYARAQGIRAQGAKLASSLQTLSACEAMLVRGKDGWRLSGALLTTNWCFVHGRQARARAGRIGRMMLRLIHGESVDTALYTTFAEFLEVLEHLPDSDGEYAEFLVALRILRILGFDAGEIPGDLSGYSREILDAVRDNRRAYLARINHGIAASGL